MIADNVIITRRFPGSVKIYPIADVHFGAISHQQGEWERFLRKVDEENAYLILNGDLINNNTRSSVGSPWEDTLRPRDQKKSMVEYLEPLRDRILCITTGNHERRSTKDADDDPTYDIACKLDLEDIYRETVCFMKVACGKSDKGNGRREAPAHSYTFAVTHGTGGGVYGGATLNRNERFGNVIDGLDCLVVGHTHKGQVSRPSKIIFDPRNNNIIMSDYLVISCVSWMTFGGYAMQKMLLPSSTAKPQALLLEAEPKRRKHITVEW